MSLPDREIDPLEMLHRASAEEATPEGAQARVWTAVTGALQAAGVADLAASSQLSKAVEVNQGPHALGMDPSAPVSGLSGMRPWVAKLLHWSAPAFVMGAAAGVTAGRSMFPAVSPAVHARSVTVDPKVMPSPIGSAIEMDVVPTPAAEPPSPVAPAGESSGGVKIGSAARELARERAILDQARAQISAGEAARALDYVQRHERRHPQGMLSEEREALAVNALVSLGRYREALQRGEAFRSRYPNSLLAPSVEAALLAIPER
jgi:hypothetical protein